MTKSEAFVNEEERLKFFWNITEFKGNRIEITVDFVHKDQLSQTVFGKDELIFNILDNELIRSKSSFKKLESFQDKSFELFGINTDLFM